MDSVTIQLPPSCDPLERRAAKELRRYVRKLFGIEARIGRAVPKRGSVFCLGTPDSNPDFTRARIDREGFRVAPERRGGARICNLVGGSPIAVLWAAYEVVAGWGVHYLVHRDVLPDSPGAFRLPTRTISRMPLLERRIYRVVNEMLNSSVSWSLAEHKRLFDQLVKLRFNAISITTYAHQPWVHWSFRGIQRRQAEILYGFRHPIHEESIGVEELGLGDYTNPDFRACVTYEHRVEAGRRFVHGLIDAAHRRGLEVIFDHSLTEIPEDQKRHLGRWSRGVALPKSPPNSTHPHSLGLARDGGEMRFGHLMTPLNPVYMQMVESWLAAHLAEYPAFDTLRLGQQEFPAASAGVEACWKALDRRHGLSRHIKLKDLLAEGKRLKFHASGRGLLQTQGAIIMVRMLDLVINEHKIVDAHRPANSGIMVGFMNHLVMPVVPLVFDPDRVEFIATVDYTPTAVAQRMSSLAFASETPMKISLITSVEDDNVGFLPQMPTRPMARIVKGIRAHGLAGYQFRHWLVSKLEPTMGYLVDAAWDPAATPDKSLRRQFNRVCGPRSAHSLLEACHRLEDALPLTDKTIGLAFMMPNLLRKYWAEELGDLRPAVKRLRRHYERILPLVRAALEQSEPRGKSYVRNALTWIEFATDYLDVVLEVDRARDCFYQAREVRGKGHSFDIERFDLLLIESADRLQKALHQLEAAMRLWARHGIHDPSDRATLAGLNVYALDFLRGKTNEVRLIAEQPSGLFL